MLGFLVALRNAMIIVLLSWLGFEAGQSDDPQNEREDAAKVMIQLIR